MRVARSGELVAEGHSPSVVARVAQISPQAIYRIAKTKPRAARRSGAPADDVEAAIVEVAQANQTDGYRMVCALVCRKLGRTVNRKRVLRVMRQRRLIQRRRRLDRRRRPGFFGVTRPNELWHLDMTSLWIAEHRLVLSKTPLGSQTLEAHRRGGYRDPESQAFIESWFSKLNERCVWLHEFETVDEAGR